MVSASSPEACLISVPSWQEIILYPVPSLTMMWLKWSKEASQNQIQSTPKRLCYYEMVSWLDVVVCKKGRVTELELTQSTRH